MLGECIDPSLHPFEGGGDFLLTPGGTEFPLNRRGQQDPKLRKNLAHRFSRGRRCGHR
jgi:hypothetical protein